LVNLIERSHTELHLKHPQFDIDSQLTNEAAIMMRTIFMLTVLLTGCQKPADQSQQKAAEPSSVKLLWMDDISMPYSGTEV